MQVEQIQTALDSHLEAQTNNVPYLEKKGFTKVILGKGATVNYWQLIIKDKEIYFSKKQVFKQLMNKKFGISIPEYVVYIKIR